MYKIAFLRLYHHIPPKGINLDFLMVCIMDSNLASWVSYLAFKANAFRIRSWNYALKLLATCQRQYRWNTRNLLSSPLSHTTMVLLILACRAKIMQMPSLGITCPIETLRHSKNHPQLSPDSLFTTAKARGKTLLLASVTIAINNTPRYLPYKWVPSILIAGLQYLNAAMHGANAQNT